MSTLLCTRGIKKSTNLGGTRWDCRKEEISTKCRVEENLNLDGGGAHPHLPPDELGSVPLYKGYHIKGSKMATTCDFALCHEIYYTNCSKGDIDFAGT
jgi:hypothetical protein